MGSHPMLKNLGFTATIACHFDFEAIAVGPLDFAIFEVDHDGSPISS